MTKAHVPSGTGFAMKPRLAIGMIQRAIAAAVAFKGVAADSVYGVSALEMAVRQAGKGDVLGVGSSHPFHSWGRDVQSAGTAAEIAKDRDPSAWRRLSAGDGTKGARPHDRAYGPLADLEAAGTTRGTTESWTRGVPIRRNIADGELAFFSTWCPTGTDMAMLVKVEGHRWAIADGFETAKTEFGLDHNEKCSFHGWHRHVSLVMLVFAMMAVIRHKANQQSPNSKKRARMNKQHGSKFAGRCRKSAASRHDWLSVASSPPISLHGQCWRRAHQAEAQQAHRMKNAQL